MASRASPSNPVSKAFLQVRLPALVPTRVRTALRMSEGLVVDLPARKVGLRLSTRKGKCTHRITNRRERKWQITPSDEGMD